MKFYTYVLHSQLTGAYYVGQTNNLASRIARHNRGQERYSKRGVPWEIVAYAEFSTRSEAMQLEKELKGMKSRKRLEEWIANNNNNTPSNKG